jgi:hypothetical protein
VASEVGVVKWQYASDGAGTYNGSWLTTAQMQAETDLTSKTNFQIKAQFNGGNETAIASVNDITVTAAADATTTVVSVLLAGGLI